jgi:galactokinase
MNLDSMAERTAELFVKCFGHPPRWIVAAPGRVNLIGEHTDYNDGFVLPMAIERYTVIAGGRMTRRVAVFHSLTTGDTAEFPVRGPITPGTPVWSNYVRGVAAGFQQFGRPIPGIEAAIDSDVPFGAGVSSSGALEVATASLMELACQQKLEPLEKARLCQHAEHAFAGVPCGIMDQFTSIMARKDHALLLDCRSLTALHVPLADPSVTVLVINTQVRRRVGEREYALRRGQCERVAAKMGVKALRDATLSQLEAARSHLDTVEYRRARHVITENQRALDTARALEQRDWPAVGQLMAASHASLRDDFEVSCPELDTVVRIARDLEPRGVIGCRMTGAGFGGCAVCLVRTDALAYVSGIMAERYEQATRIQAHLFSSRPAAGARVLS